MDWEAIALLVYIWVQRIPVFLRILKVVQQRFGLRKALRFTNAMMVGYRKVVSDLLEHSRPLDPEFVEEFIREGVEKDLEGVKVRVRMGGEVS